MFFVVGLAALAQASLSAGSSSTAESPLARWSGCWAAEGQELNNKGEMFRQVGRAHAVLEENGSALRISMNYDVVQATGYYTRLSRQRSDTQLLRLKPGQAFLTQEDVSNAGPLPQSSRDVSVSADGNALFKSFMFYHPVRRHTLFAMTTQRLVDRNRVEIETSLSDPHGTFRETYIEVWQRRPNADALCQGDRKAAG